MFTKHRRSKSLVTGQSYRPTVLPRRTPGLRKMLFLPVLHGKIETCASQGILQMTCKGFLDGFGIVGFIGILGQRFRWGIWPPSARYNKPSCISAVHQIHVKKTSDGRKLNGLKKEKDIIDIKTQIHASQFFGSVWFFRKVENRCGSRFFVDPWF